MAIRGRPAKALAGLNRARVRIPPSPPRAEDSIFRRFMNNKSSPARGRKRVTQCAGMRIKNSTRLWRSKHNWYCHGLENRSSATACRFESCLLRHTYGSIAQLAEHLISNQEVVGSSPTGASICGVSSAG